MASVISAKSAKAQRPLGGRIGKESEVGGPFDVVLTWMDSCGNGARANLKSPWPRSPQMRIFEILRVNLSMGWKIVKDFNTSGA